MRALFPRRGRAWARVLSLLLLGNGILHWCYHEHLGAVESSSYRECRPVELDASAGDCRHAAALTNNTFCPCCSASIDWFADIAAPEAALLRETAEEIRFTPAFPGAVSTSYHRSRAPPRA
ncbi:MAG: hypothetical protein MR051_06325 [Lentisphaeria bacterium]|nr:hypothetical protein [Lentisphaeria bacterium]